MMVMGSNILRIQTGLQTNTVILDLSAIFNAVRRPVYNIGDLYIASFHCSTATFWTFSRANPDLINDLSMLALDIWDLNSARFHRPFMIPNIYPLTT